MEGMTGMTPSDLIFVLESATPAEQVAIGAALVRILDNVGPANVATLRAKLRIGDSYSRHKVDTTVYKDE